MQRMALNSTLDQKDHGIAIKDNRDDWGHGHMNCKLHDSPVSKPNFLSLEHCIVFMKENVFACKRCSVSCGKGAYYLQLAPKWFRKTKQKNPVCVKTKRMIKQMWQILTS